MRFFLSIVCIWAFASMPLKALEVTATIPPLAFIASAITKGTNAHVTPLLGGGTSPHTQSLKPGHRAALRNADIVVWIGPGYESFLGKLMAGSDLVKATGEKPAIVEAAALALPYLYPQRGGDHCCHHHDAHHANHDETGANHHHGHGHPVDAHVWLDPRNGAAIALALADRLRVLDPQNSAQYQKNAALFVRDMQALHHTLKNLLKGVTHRSFYTYHDGYQYFERAYDLSGLGALSKGHHGSLSLKQMQALTRTIREQGVAALFAERQFRGSTVASLGEALDLPTGLLDPFGEDLPISPDSYGVLLTRLADAMANTLRGVR